MPSAVLLLAPACGERAARQTSPPHAATSAAVAAAPTTIPATHPPAATPGAPPTPAETSATTPPPPAATTAEPPPAPATADAATFGALDVLTLIPMINEHRGGYDRGLFEEGVIGVDGCTARQSALIRDADGGAAVDGACEVTAGSWLSPYDGLRITDIGEVEIDHVVALKEVWDSGGWAWTAEQRRAYANDLTDRRTLRVVSSVSNQAKGDRDPSNWIPDDEAAVCAFIGDWVAIKARWLLSMDSSEWGRIKNLLNGRCAGLRIAPWAAVPGLPMPTVTIETATPELPTVALTPALTPVTPPPSVYYANCAAARAAGAAPIHSGEPGYRDGLDRDHDGVACE